MRVLNSTLCFDPPLPSEKRASSKKYRQVLVPESFDTVDPKNCRLLLNGNITDTSSSCSNTETDRSSLGTESIQSRDCRRRKYRTGISCLLVFGSMNLIFGILTFIWTPFDLFMNERLKMVPGFPPYEWWRLPPDEVLMRVYVFNVTNSEEFLNGTDKKIKFQEIGPFVFLEKLVHTNITFNDDDTMTYLAHRTAIFMPHMTSASLNSTIIIPNLPLLGMASKLHDASFFTKFGFNMLVRRHESKPFMTLTVDDYFWNLTDSLVNTGRKLMPLLVPMDNLGVLHRIYSDFKDEVTVYMGPENARRFFTMAEFHGSERFHYWPEERCDLVEGGTEGVTYQQFITRNDTLNYFRKTMCRITPVVYVADVVVNDMDVFRFELPDDTFHRPLNASEDCYSLPGVPVLPSGITDMSPCYFDFPIASSMPHFLTGDEILLDKIEGMQPIRDKHVSYVIVEPATGIPVESRARSQSNLVIRPLSGFGDLAKFSDLVLPMFWIEYNQVGLPWYVEYLMYFTVKVLPTLQTWLSYISTMLGTSMMLAAVYLIHHMRCHLRPYQYSSLDLIPSTASSDC